MNKIVLERLDQARDYFTFLQVMEDVHAWVKDLGGRFVMVNGSFLKWYGLADEHQVLGQTDYELHEHIYADQFRADDERVLSGRSMLDRLEVVPSKEAGILWFSTSKWPIYDKQDNIIGSFGISRHMNQGQGEREAAQELDACITYVQQNYAEKLSVNELAMAMHLSVSAIERRFKKHLKQTPRQFITEVRLDRAHELLRTTEKPISVIAQETGFSDNSHLTRCFKKRFAVNPTQARRQLINS